MSTPETSSGAGKEKKQQVWRIERWRDERSRGDVSLWRGEDFVSAGINWGPAAKIRDFLNRMAAEWAPCTVCGFWREIGAACERRWAQPLEEKDALNLQMVLEALRGLLDMIANMSPNDWQDANQESSPELPQITAAKKCLSSHAPKSDSASSVASGEPIKIGGTHQCSLCGEEFDSAYIHTCSSPSPGLPVIEGEKWTVNTAILQRSSMCSLSTSPKGTHWFFPKECVSNVQEIADNHNASLERVKKAYEI